MKIYLFRLVIKYYEKEFGKDMNIRMRSYMECKFLFALLKNIARLCVIFLESLRQDFCSVWLIKCVFWDCSLWNLILVLNARFLFDYFCFLWLKLDWRLSDEIPTEDCCEEERDLAYRESVRCKVFLGFTSNLTSSGIRDIIRYLCQHHMVSDVHKLYLFDIFADFT